jgi:hypothetical protein
VFALPTLISFRAGGSSFCSRWCSTECAGYAGGANAAVPAPTDEGTSECGFVDAGSAAAAEVAEDEVDVRRAGPGPERWGCAG